MTLLSRLLFALCLSFGAAAQEQPELAFEIPTGTETLEFDAPMTGLLRVQFDPDPDLTYQPGINLATGDAIEVQHDVIRVDAPGPISMGVDWPQTWLKPTATGTMSFAEAYSSGEPDDNIDQARLIEPNSHFLISLLSPGDRDHIRIDVSEPSRVSVTSANPELIWITPAQGGDWAPRRGSVENGAPFIIKEPLVLEIAHIGGEQVVVETSAYLEVLPFETPQPSVFIGEPSSVIAQPSQTPTVIDFEAPEDGIYRVSVETPDGMPVKAWLTNTPDMFADVREPITVPLKRGIHELSVALEDNSFGVRPITLQVDLWDKDSREVSEGGADIETEIDRDTTVYLHRGGDRDVVSVSSTEAGYVSFEVYGSPDTITLLGHGSAQRQSNTRDVFRAVSLLEDGEEVSVAWAPWGEGGRRYGPVEISSAPVRLAIWSTEEEHAYELSIVPRFIAQKPNDNIRLVAFGLNKKATESMAMGAKAAGVTFYAAGNEEALIAIMDEVAEASIPPERSGRGLIWVGIAVVVSVIIGLVFWRRKNRPTQSTPSS